MRYRSLADTGERVPVLGLGTWAIGGDMWGPADERQSVETVRAAVDAGVVLVDTAPIYGDGTSERVVGQALEGLRSRVFLATKCGLRRDRDGSIVRDLRPDSVRREVEESLRRLRVETIDLYQCHWPDEETPIEDTAEALERIREEGKIRHWGVSNFEPRHIEAALGSGRPVSLQSQYSIVERLVEDGPLAMAKARDLSFLAYGPIAGGLLAGKYDTSGPPPRFDAGDARSFFYRFFSEPGWSRVASLVDTTVECARQMGTTPANLAVAWVLGRPGVTSALVGARSPQQALENARAADLDVEPAIIERIEDAYARISYLPPPR
jgi:aryl-alcohol dehydrogenase-like predicted oxidoreductase